MCFSTACLPALELENKHTDFQRWWAVCFFQIPFLLSLLFKPFGLRHSILQLVCAAFSRADTTNISPALWLYYRLYLGLGLTLILQLVKPITCLWSASNSFAQYPYWPSAAIRSAACCSWTLQTPPKRCIAQCVAGKRAVKISCYFSI